MNEETTKCIIAEPVVPAGVDAGIGARTWKARVVDKMALIKAAVDNSFLAALLTIDEGALNKLAVIQKGELRIPGIEVYAVDSTSIRKAR